MYSLEYHHSDEIYRAANGNSVHIGDLASAEDIELLKDKNIRTVITAAEGFNLKYDSSVRHYRYALQDRKSQNILRYFDDAANKIERSLKYGSVLVHCGAGVSRSTSLVIAFLIKYKKLTFPAALKLTKQKRPGVCPNLGFELQLKSYDLLQRKNIQSKMSNSPIIPEHETKQYSFPEILKSRQLNLFTTTHGRNPFYLQSKLVRGRSTLTRSINQSQKNRNLHNQKQLDYLRKIAQFRFGITNTEKWKMGG